MARDNHETVLTIRTNLVLLVGGATEPSGAITEAGSIVKFIRRSRTTDRTKQSVYQPLCWLSVDASDFMNGIDEEGSISTQSGDMRYTRDVTPGFA